MAMQGHFDVDQISGIRDNTKLFQITRKSTFNNQAINHLDDNDVHQSVWGERS